MRENQKYNKNVQNLENFTENELKNIMNGQLVLYDFVGNWLDLFKKNSVKTATYSRLQCSHNTLKQYEISQKPICEINYFDIQKYINTLVEDGYSISNIKKQVLIVTAPLKQAAAMKVISADPCIGIKMPSESRVKKKTKEVVAYTRQEQDRIWKNIINQPNNAGYNAVAFQLETGLRSGELLALKWSDIQLDRSRMRVHATIVNPHNYSDATYQDSAKSKSSNRVIPLTPKAISILKNLQSRRTTEWAFEQDGERYTYQKLVYQTKKLCRESKVKYHGEHVFRHTFATNCYYKGIDIKILSRLMGHSSVQVTYNIYINLYGDGFDDMYAALCF